MRVSRVEETAPALEEVQGGGRRKGRCQVSGVLGAAWAAPPPGALPHVQRSSRQSPLSQTLERCELGLDSPTTGFGPFLLPRPGLRLARGSSP